MAGPSGSTPNLQLPYPLPGDTVDVPRDIQALATKIDAYLAVPVGSLLMWPTNVPPAGFLLCNGSQVSAATYPQLAAILGQSAGNVTLPDYRDRFPVGAGPTMALGTLGGESSHKLSAAESGIPAHDHPVGPNASNNVPNTTGAGGVWALGSVTYGQGSFTNAMVLHGGGTFSVTSRTGNAAAVAAANAHENRPPFRAINFIIRAA